MHRSRARRTAIFLCTPKTPKSWQEAAEYVEDIVGHKVEADVTSIQKALSDYEDEYKYKEEKYMYYSFHEFKLTD